MKQLIQTFSADGFLVARRWITSEAEYTAHMRKMAAEYEGCYTVTGEDANPHDAGGPGHPCGYGAEQDDYDATVAHMGREW